MEEQDFRVNSKKQDYERNNHIRKMWDHISQRPSEFDMQIIDALKVTITGNNTDDIEYACYGEDIYLIIRKQLTTYKHHTGLIINFLQSNDNSHDIASKSIHNKQLITYQNKADKIRHESTLKKIQERLKIILDSFNITNLTIPPESVMDSKILEWRALGYIYIAWFICKHSYTTKIIPFSIIVSLQRFINIITGYVGYNATNPATNIAISQTLITDLKNIENILIKQYSFNGVTLYEQASELILGSQFDTYLPCKRRSAFEHQKLVSNTLMDITNLKNGFIMFYRTMTNSGKTSTIINIATAVLELRKRYPTVFGNLQVLATCDVQPVITRWGQLLYHAGIPFGIGTVRHYPNNPEIAQRIKHKALKEIENDPDCVDINMRFSNSDTCKSIKDRAVIICPTDIAVKILTNTSNGTATSTRFILLHDEPTMYADNANDTQLNINMQVMKYAPKWAIFSSATLPFDEKSQVFIDHHKTKFPNAIFIDNCSTEIYSCCNMRTFDNKLITPHLGCKTREELKNAIKNIEQNPFLGKLYTPTSIKLLWDEAIEVGSKNSEFMRVLPNIMDYFSKVENLYPDNIRKIALEILHSILLLNDKQITYICSMDYEDDSDDESPINFNKLGTTEAYKFPYLNLVASNNPLELMNSHYADLVADIKKKIGSLDKLHNEYEKMLKLWQTTYDNLEKNIKNPDQLSMAQSEMNESRPSMIFPEDCQINTKQHSMRYAKEKIAGDKFRIPNNINNFNLDDLHITDDNKLQLLSGVCSYITQHNNSNHHNTIDLNYLNIALDLTSQKKMETLIADTGICYGTDYPIGGVIITKEFSDSHSLNTIYQLMSRAGRGRKSNNAEIYVDYSCAENILNSVKLGNNYVSSEIDNMIHVFNNELFK